VLSFVAIAHICEHDLHMVNGAPRTARERVRAELTSEITRTARRQLAESGAAGLSLRAVARELNMVSSALYRYFPSRDELLTALIVEAYTSLAETAEAADARVRRSDPLGRWLAVTGAVRGWAVAQPHEYALIYGSPVPGYSAPQDTIDPASRLPLLLLDIAAGAAPDAVAAPRGVPRQVRSDLTDLRRSAALELDDPTLLRALGAYAELIGLINLELFGHLHNVITDGEAHFTVQMRRLGDELGLRRRRAAG
jgi:AcrR family transcriptional regulator